MDATERARLRALCEAATPGPWDAIYDEDAGEWMVRTGHADVAVLTWQQAIDALGLSPMTMRTAAFIAASRTAIPALLDDSERLDAAERERDEARAEVERLRAAITRLRDNAAEMQSCARAVGHVEEREACAELADAIRDAAWTAGAEAMREAILDELPCVSAERDECAARMHRVAIPAPPCPEVSR